MSKSWRKISVVRILYFAWLCVICGCASYYRDDRLNVVVTNQQARVRLMDFSKPISLQPMEQGWYLYRFHERQSQSIQIDFLKKDDFASIYLKAEQSASMIFREVDIPILTIYEKIWSKGEKPRLTDIGLVADNDQTKQSAASYFADVDAVQIPTQRADAP